MLKVFILTSKCNLNCEFCICQDEKELTTALVKNKLNSCSGTVIFTGGEPLLRADINELCKYAKNKKLKVGIHTNGALLNKLDLDNIDFINLPLDGTRKTHNQLRNNNYNSVIKALKRLKKKKIETRISTVATKLNYQDIANISQLTKEYEIKLWRIFKFTDNNKKMETKYGLTNSEFNKLKKIKANCQTEFVENINKFGDGVKIAR